MPSQLAQINIARLIAPLDDPRIADSVAQLDSVNALAEQSFEKRTGIRTQGRLPTNKAATRL
jgi:hypothetical protein